jgi:hypothetical protein
VDDKKERKFSLSDIFEIWIMAYKRGYENGYMDKAIGCEYNSGTYEQPPEVLRKIFEPSEEE